MTFDEILSKMRARYRELSGFDADHASDIGIRLRVLAAEAASLYESLAELRAQIFPQTSSGEYLELHAQSRAITRKAAIPAIGSLTFSRETPAYSDIFIPAGVLCSTKSEPQVQFVTSEDATLVADATEVTVAAVAVDAGTIGNVAAFAVTVMISPAVGITNVKNSEPFFGGTDQENDDALRGRLIAAYQNISNGTNSAFYYDLAMSNEGVFSANILPRRRGRGTVDVVITSHSDILEDEIVDAIQSDLDVRKEINVDVKVSAAVRDYLAVSVEIAIKDGYNFALVSQKANEIIQNTINELGVGTPLLLASIGSKLLQVDGLYNYRILSPVNDVLPASDHVLRAGSITLSGMAVG